MSQLEDQFFNWFRLLDLPEPEREYIFAPPRRWRFDFRWPGHMLAVEVEGGVYTNGRHNRETLPAPDGYRMGTRW